MPDENTGETRPTKIKPDELPSTQPTRAPKSALGTKQHARREPRPSGGTRPVRVRPASPPPQKPAPPSRLRSCLTTLLSGIPFLLTILLFMFLAGYLGLQSAGQDRALQATIEAATSLEEQYLLAQQDMQAGLYDRARQRYEYIFSLDPEYRDVADLWLKVMFILGGTATPTSLPATPTLTPTPDTRPVEQLFASAQAFLAAQQWGPAIDTITSLRKADPNYQVVDVDGMLFVALHNRGLETIRSVGDLEGGLYDFSLAEKFAPLDAEASGLRDLARLYLIGNSFWVAYPETAAYYYGQVAAVAPYMIDASGLTAFYRYWASLVQWADQLAASGDWCAAAEQYQVALSVKNDSIIAATAVAASQLCATATPPFTPTYPYTLTPSLTPTVPVGPSPTPTPSPTGESASPTPSPTPSPSATPSPSPTS